MGYLGDSVYKMLVSVKDCDGSKILPHLQANKLPASFMGIGRRHKTLGWETKGFFYL